MGHSHPAIALASREVSHLTLLISQWLWCVAGWR